MKVTGQLFGGGKAGAGRRAGRIPAGLLLATLSLLAPAAARGEDGTLEKALKVTYLYKFPPFVQWPAGTLDSAEAPYVICVAGPDSMSDLLERAVRDMRIDDHPIAVRLWQPAAPEPGCQMLFATGPPGMVEQALQAVNGTPVLTVTDAGPEEAAKGIINFVIENNHVRFQIDEAAAARNHLRLSSKLLSLASAVRR